MIYLIHILYHSCFVTQFIMEDLFITGTPLLESVGDKEPHVVELREGIRRALQFAVVPMLAYARKYEQFLDLNGTDLAKYIRFVASMYFFRIQSCAFLTNVFFVESEILLYLTRNRFFLTKLFRLWRQRNPRRTLDGFVCAL